MMTLREARQRASINGARITFNRDTGEYRVTLNEWPIYARSTEDRAYYTDDIDDAVLTSGALRREAAKAIA